MRLRDGAEPVSYPLRHRNPVQVAGDGELAGESRLARLAFEVWGVGVPLGEVGHPRVPDAGERGHARRLPRRQVAVLTGERFVLVEEGRLDDEEVAAGREVEDGVAQPGVHDEREALATP